MDFVDRFSSTLASAYTAGGSSMILSSATGLPSGPCYFFLIVRAEGGNTEEVVLVTDVTGATLTVDGAQAETAASNHSSGAVVVGSIMTRVAFERLAETDVLSLDKPGGAIGSAKIEGATLTASSTTTLVDLSNGPGYVSSLSVFFTNSDFANAAQQSILKITVDGDVIFEDRIPLFFAAEYLYNTGNFRSMFNAGQTNNSNNVGYVSYTPIPYSDTFKVELTNGSGSTSSLVWANFTFHTGVSNNWPRTRKLRTASGTSLNNPVDTVKTLVDVTDLLPGRLMGVYISLDSFPNSANPLTAPMEGNIKIYIDESVTPSLETSGFEDYFQWSNYFETLGVPNVDSSFHVDQFWTGLQFKSTSSPNTWNAYRYHIPDKILFSNALKITYNCGDSSQVNYTGGVRVAWCIWYYTE